MGSVTVKGATYNGAMPPQGAAMSDADIANVLTYIRNTWGNEGSMVTKDMVASVRAKEKARTAPWTAADLAPFAEKNIAGEVPGGPGAAAAEPAAKK
jgi:hypothetical protein